MLFTFFIIFLITSLVSATYFYQKKIRYQYKFKHWCFDDIISFKLNGVRCFAKLKGLTKDYVIVELDSGGLLRLNMNDVVNEFLKWRTYYDECEQFMGKEPKFPYLINDSTNFNNDISDSDIEDIKTFGKPVSLMTEYDCLSLIKYLVDEELFEKANIIKKRLDDINLEKSKTKK